MQSRGRDHAGDVQDVVAMRLPGYRVHSMVLLGEGQDNIAYEVNGELIVRFSKEPDPAVRAAQVRDEAGLLATVADISPLPVPEPSFTVAEEGCLAYFKLPGTPLIDLAASRRSADTAAIAATLGELLNALHGVPIGRMAELVDTDDQPKELWLREAAETYAMVADQVPPVYRHAVEAFLDAPPPADGHALAFSHNDLGIEHVLVDPAGRAVTGVIDWSDAAIVDPAYDFGLIHRDLGPLAVRAALSRYRTGAHEAEAISARAAFYARCSVFEDMAYGIDTGHGSYRTKSLTALRWLFPA
ncbi:aminoglycoside phosphotransferase family protein [Sphaerisporangium sp. NPDC005288]|uniref:phosphotransferase family protein n=1 Tax=Sphaerisporangium sp. NPDC005288 TaxID=3155114 RepID=UPI0033AA1928